MKRKQGIIAVLSVIYALCIVYGADIMYYDTIAYLSGKTWLRILRWSVIMYFLASLCHLFIAKILGIIAQKKIKSFNSKSFFFVIWGAILLGWLPIYGACYPGLGIYDGPSQLGGEITTHHPLVHTLFIHAMDFLAQRAGWRSWLVPYAVIQMGALSAVFAYLLTYLRSKGFGTVYLSVILAWFVLFPMNPMMAIATTKDTLFSAAFIMFVCELSKINTGGGIGERIVIASGLRVSAVCYAYGAIMVFMC